MISISVDQKIAQLIVLLQALEEISTLVVYESLQQYAANLPLAKFRAPHGATPKA